MNLETERLLLRDYLEDLSDLESVLLFTTDSLVATHSSWGPLTEEETREWLGKTLSYVGEVPRTHYELAIVDRETGEVIGNASLLQRSAEVSEASIGYTLRRDQWGKGFATEVARALVSFGFDDLGLRKLVATTSPANLASQRVLEKAGFRKEAFLEKNVLQRGVWRDSVLFSISGMTS